MLILKKLRLRAIGRFVDEQVIDIEKLSNLVQVDGQNNNTGGSSGAAKSTIFNALDFLFGLNTTPNSVLQSRLTDDSMFVEGTFDFDGLPLIITRSKKLKIELDGKVTTGSSKLSEEKLDQILSIPRNLFRPMLHKKQGERGFFLSLTPKETNDFLTDCSGFSRFKKHIIDLDEKIVELTKTVSSLNISLENKKSALSATQNAIESLGEAPIKEISKEMVLALKGKSDASNSVLSELVAKHKLEMANLELTKPISSQYTFDYSLRNSLENELKLVEKQANQLLIDETARVHEVQKSILETQAKKADLKNKIQKAEEATKQAVKTATEIRKLRENICFTCEQQWLTDTARKKEAELLETIKKYKEIIDPKVNLISQSEYLETQLTDLILQSEVKLPDGHSELTNKIKDLKASIELDKANETKVRNAHFEVQKKERDEFDNKYKQLKTSHAVELQQANGQAQLDTKLFESAVTKMKMYEDSRTRHEKTSISLEQQKKSCNEEIFKITQDLAIQDKQLSKMEELKRAVKSYLSCSFEQILEDISENATNLVRNVPNMANATVQLTSIRETKEGKLKEEVNAVLHMDGEENIDIRSLSGGERSSVDLAIDLSVMTLIERETNKGINIFILDEPFNGLDSVCSEMALEILKNTHSNKKILVVDHNPIVKESISDKILVIRNGETSNVRSETD